MSYRWLYPKEITDLNCIILSADRFEASNFPRKHTGIWLSSVSKEWEIWTLPGWGENFNRNCHSVKSFSGKHVFYLLIRKSLKEKSSLSRADGSEEKVYKFVSWVEHKNPILAREGRKFVQTNLQKVQMPGWLPGGDAEASNWSTHYLPDCRAGEPGKNKIIISLCSGHLNLS